MDKQSEKILYHRIERLKKQRDKLKVENSLLRNGQDNSSRDFCCFGLFTGIALSICTVYTVCLFSV